MHHGVCSLSRKQTYSPSSTTRLFCSPTTEAPEHVAPDYLFMRQERGYGRRRPDSRNVLLHKMVSVVGYWCGQPVRMQCLDRLCDCSFPSCRATGLGATARRNKIHSVDCPVSIGGVGPFSCFIDG